MSSSVNGTGESAGEKNPEAIDADRRAALEFLALRNPNLGADIGRILRGIAPESEQEARERLAAALAAEWLQRMNAAMRAIHASKPEGQIRPLEEDCIELVTALRTEISELRRLRTLLHAMPRTHEDAGIAKLEEYLDIMERYPGPIEKPMKEALAQADEEAVWRAQDEFNKVMLIIEELVGDVADDRPIEQSAVEARLLRRMAWMPNPRFWPLEGGLREFVRRLRGGIELRRVDGRWTELARDEKWRPIIDHDSWMFVRRAVEAAGVIGAADAIETHITLIESHGAEIGRPIREALAAGDHEAVARILREFDEVIRTVDGLMDCIRTGTAPERGAAGAELLKDMAGVS